MNRVRAAVQKSALQIDSKLLNPEPRLFGELSGAHPPSNVSLSISAFFSDFSARFNDPLLYALSLAVFSTSSLVLRAARPVRWGAGSGGLPDDPAATPGMHLGREWPFGYRVFF